MFKDNQQSIFKGKKLTLTIFGASHAPEIGVTAKGLKGVRFDKEKLCEFMDRRKPKNTAFSTKRLENDRVIFEQGETDGVIDGELRAVIKNTEQKSQDYKNVVKIPRPSHADFVAWTKYGDGFDFRGGGKFSGRMTAPMCIVGGILKQALEKKGVKINAYISAIGSVVGKGYSDIDQENFDYSKIDKDFPVIDLGDKVVMLDEIERARLAMDSVGGVIDCVITGVPIGAGEYMFDSIEGEIAKLAFAVPAVKGVEFGSGFGLAKMRGSKANDTFFVDEQGKVKTKTNNNGGINGGLSNGMPITFRVVIKPTPSIGIEQETVDLVKMEKTRLQIQGRHDACIVPRAVPVIEAIASIAVYDLI